MHTKKVTAEDKEQERKGSPVCVYGDMELQERANVQDFMSGPYNEEEEDETNASDITEDNVESIGNQIMDYLFGRNPTLEVNDSESNAQEDKLDVKPKQGTKVNSRDSRLHFLMGQYNSNKGLFAHDDLAHEIRHRMALDTAFFSLFPDIYEVDGTAELPHPT